MVRSRLLRNRPRPIRRSIINDNQLPITPQPKQIIILQEQRYQAVRKIFFLIPRRNHHRKPQPHPTHHHRNRRLHRGLYSLIIDRKLSKYMVFLRKFWRETGQTRRVIHNFVL